MQDVKAQLEMVKAAIEATMKKLEETADEGGMSERQRRRIAIDLPDLKSQWIAVSADLTAYEASQTVMRKPSSEQIEALSKATLTLSEQTTKSQEVGAMLDAVTALLQTTRDFVRA